jgi:hypothetical protein
VQSVLVSTAVLRDLVNQDRDFGYWAIHPVEQAQFKWKRDPREAFRPIRLDLAIFDLLSASDNLSQPLAFDGCRDPVVADSHRRSGHMMGGTVGSLNCRPFSSPLQVVWG